MTPDAPNPEPNDPLWQPAASPLAKPIPQTDPSGDRKGQVSGERGMGLSLPQPPRFDEKKEAAPVPKPKRWPMVAVAALVIAAAFAGVMISQNSSSSGNSSPTIVAAQGENVITFTGADVDQRATDQAIADLKANTGSPELAALPDSVKQEILNGERKFYRIPTTLPDGTSAFQSGDRISVDFNGIGYGTYDLSQPVTLNMPLRFGDVIGVHCLSVAQGKTSLVVDLATVLNPVRCNPLSAGESQTLHVQSGNAGQNYAWFEQEAGAGNPVAQYGLGHMYQYGLGVAQDKGTAMHWYEKAASQNYLDAKAQLQLLQSNP